MNKNEKINNLINQYKNDIKNTSEYINEISGCHDQRTQEVIARLRDRNHVMRCLVDSLIVIFED